MSSRTRCKRAVFLQRSWCNARNIYQSFNGRYLMPNTMKLERVKNFVRPRLKGESHFSVLPLPLSFARSRESKGYPNSRFDRGVGLRGRGRYPLKPSIFASLLETKGGTRNTAHRQQCRPDHPESPIFGLNNDLKITTVLFCALHSPVHIYLQPCS